jgi:hypothetical protein
MSSRLDGSNESRRVSAKCRRGSTDQMSLVESPREWTYSCSLFEAPLSSLRYYKVMVRHVKKDSVCGERHDLLTI